MEFDGRIILPMPAVYTTPPHLRPVTVSRLHLAEGRVGSASLAPMAVACRHRRAYNALALTRLTTNQGPA